MLKYIVQVPANDTGEYEMPVPPAFFDSIEEAGLEGEYKVEVLGKADNRNATITEHGFELEEPAP